jgi:hypothetical protein
MMMWCITCHKNMHFIRWQNTATCLKCGSCRRIE